MTRRRCASLPEGAPWTSKSTKSRWLPHRAHTLTCDHACSSTWPLLLTTVLSRIDTVCPTMCPLLVPSQAVLTFSQIAHKEFPIPRIPPPTTAAPASPPEPRLLAPLPPSSDAVEPSSSVPDAESGAAAASSNNTSAASSQETNKENAAPPDQEPPSQPPPSDPEPDAPQSSVAELEPGALPPQITAMLAEIAGVLNETFHTYPPHTIQRLAELVLEPRRHYRSLPAYLHAVDRVVHVTSGNNIYPLPPAIPDMSHMSINGFVDGQDGDGAGDGGSDSAQAIWASSNNGSLIGSDEALGGALLTPIPWLARRATNGDGGSESGESSTLGSDGGPSPLGPAAGAGQGQSRQSQGRQFEMQVRTESTETIDGPNGMGSIETVSVVNGISSLSPAQQQRVITQGELIRQEQRAGVVPVSQLSRTGTVVVASSSGGGASSAAASVDAGSDTAMGENGVAATEQGEGEDGAPKDNVSEKSDEDMPDEEAPHARGPDLIGAADMGPQTPSSSTFSISSGGNPEVRGIDVEAAVGRRNEDQGPALESEGEASAKPESSGEGIVLTSASSEPGLDAAAAAEEPSTANPEAGASKDGESRGRESEDAEDGEGEQAQLPEAMEAEASSSTVAASPSPAPGKRELEDDVADTESTSSKRLKGSPENGDAGVSMGQTTPPAAEASAEEAERGAQKEQEGEADDSAAQPEVDAEGDVALPDQVAGSATAAGGTAEASTDEKKEADEAAAETDKEEPDESAE